MRGICKAFPGVQALWDVDLTLRSGEVLALLGENGAGKSTLMKVLGGAVHPDRGTIEIDGRPVAIRAPEDAQRAGVSIIYQEFNLVPGLTAEENIFLGRERRRWGFVDRRSERRAARELFERLGVSIDPETPCRRLSVAQQQIVEVAKALALRARILVMDEPTATLTPSEVQRLFQVIRDLKARGLGIVYISHRLEEIFEIADRVTVLRDGRNVAEAAVGEVTRDRLIRWMVGRELKDEFPPRSVEPGPVRFVVRNLSRGDAVRDVSFEVRRGEVLGVTGLVGAGRTEAARLIFGADRRDGGVVELDGRRLTIRRPRDAIRAGIGLLPEDRKAQGLVLKLSVRENFALANLDRFAVFGWIRSQQERRELSEYVRKLRIKVPDTEQPVRNLSGGNQQKVVLAKWLVRHCEVLIFDEPTRGVDVGAKFEIYQLINEAAASGKCVIMISSELPEVLGMADRIVVMHGGRVTGEIADARRATQEDVMRLAVQ
ncbi:MAG: sugar ABC transporter ATP-binding protein [Planctomycetota bacterium]|nr:MAG: sugar ABC transporter ATP-binding protein [Planctomycetota bacterium]